MATLQNVNTTSLRAAIELGCRTMHNVFNADDNHIPFFIASVAPRVEFAFNDSFSEAHVPGRHLNALLTAEAVADIPVADEAIDHLTRAAFYSFGGALPLPLNRAAITDAQPTRFLTHNLREGLHALYALITYRNSSEARRLMERCLDAVNRLWSPDTGWDAAAFAAANVQLIEWNHPQQSPFITGIARAIGPLVKLYRTAQYQPALDLAQTIAALATRDYFTPSGEYSVEHFGGHVHSTTCTLSGLAQLADLTDDAALMARVQAFYTRGLPHISDQIGWSIENSHAGSVADRGEANNTGDILETALILASHGYPAGFEDAERILRCHLLPSQVRDISFIQNPPNPNREDRLHQVAERHMGAFGFPAPYGHKPLDADWVGFNLDIVGGAVASICAALDATVEFNDEGHRVNMLFDCETEQIRIASPYGRRGVGIWCKRQAPLTLQLPSWVDLDTVTITGAQGHIDSDNRRVMIPQPPLGQEIVIDFPLPKRTITLAHRTRNIRVNLLGDTVTQMENFGAEWTFFAPFA